MKHTTAFIYAHPDDETFLSACLIRQLADAGHKVVLLLAGTIPSLRYLFNELAGKRKERKVTPSFSGRP